MKKYLTIIMIIIILITIYIICLLDTNNVIKDFKKCIHEQKITNTLFDMYIGYDESNGVMADAEVNIYRKFVLHNFNKGVMYVTYSYTLYNNKHEIIKGSWNVHAQWLIEKENGKWIVKTIQEKP